MTESGHVDGRERFESLRELTTSPTYEATLQKVLYNSEPFTSSRFKNTAYCHKPHGGGYGLLTPTRSIERKARIYLASGECYCLQVIACTASATSLSTISIYRHTHFSREKNSSPPSESELEHIWTLHLRRDLASNPNTLLQKRACGNTQTGSIALLHKIPRHSSSCW